MQGYGNLTKAVGIPCKACKSIQCMESPPGVGWKSNQVLQNTWMEIQPSYSKIHNNNPQKLMSNMKVNVNCCNLMKVKVNCYNPKSLNDEMNVFFSVEMGNSLQQHRSAIGCFHGGTKWRKKDKKDNMFIWHAKKDLVFSMVFLQLLLLVVITMKVEVAFDPGSGPDYFKVMQNPSLLGGVSVHLFFVFVHL